MGLKKGNTKTEKGGWKNSISNNLKGLLTMPEVRMFHLKIFNRYAHLLKSIGSVRLIHIKTAPSGGKERFESNIYANNTYIYNIFKITRPAVAIIAGYEWEFRRLLDDKKVKLSKAERETLLLQLSHKSHLSQEWIKFRDHLSKVSRNEKKSLQQASRFLPDKLSQHANGSPFYSYSLADDFAGTMNLTVPPSLIPTNNNIVNLKKTSPVIFNVRYENLPGIAKSLVPAVPSVITVYKNRLDLKKTSPVTLNLRHEKLAGRMKSALPDIPEKKDRFSAPLDYVTTENFSEERVRDLIVRDLLPIHSGISSRQLTHKTVISRTDLRGKSHDGERMTGRVAIHRTNRNLRDTKLVYNVKPLPEDDSVRQAESHAAATLVETNHTVRNFTESHIKEIVAREVQETIKTVRLDNFESRLYDLFEEKLVIELERRG